MFVEDRRTLRVLTSEAHEYFAAGEVAPNEVGMELRLCHAQGHVSELEARVCPEGMNLPEILHVALDPKGRLARLASQNGEPPALNTDRGA